MNAGRIQNPYFRMLSLLLEYPCAGFPDKLSEIERYLATEQARAYQGHDLAVSAVEQMRRYDLLALQQIYVDTFDLTATHSLNLTAHLLEEQDRRRGTVLIGLRRHYAAAGLEMVSGELPDYLPLILEYAATLDVDKAWAFLAETAQAVEILASNLRRADSLYAKVVGALERAVAACKGEPKIGAVESQS